MSVPADRFREVLGHYPTGVVIVSSIGRDGTPVGMVVGTFTSVSLDPLLVGFLPARSSRTWVEIERAGKFCVNILASDQHELCHRFSSRDGEKFSGLAFAFSDRGCPILPGIIGWVDCELRDVIEAGDHVFVLGEVLALDVGRDEAPMLFHKGRLGAMAMSARA